MVQVTKSKKNNWGFALFLTLPVFLFIALYYLKAGDSIPTGFLQYDNITYIAYAKQYSDAERFSIFYSNPFNDSEHYPKIYFQVQNFVFLILMKMGVPPGVILILFTLFFSLVTFRILISLYDHLMPNSKNRKTAIVLFSWGGGLLTLAGVAALKFIPFNDLDIWDRLFVLDPGWGWWGLNLGRSLIFSTEAYYHALFFGGILSILKKRWRIAAGLSVLLFLSHPYTGVEYLSIIMFWLFVEIIIKRNKEIPAWFGAFNLCILLAHLWYYMIFLNQFPDHHSVHEQCSLGLIVPYYTLMPAYGLVALLVLLSLRFSVSLRSYFSASSNRLFVCWFAVTFMLINHEFFMRAMEPVHFTRGYVWSSLFLLGLPGLERLLNFIRNKSLMIVYPFLILLFLSDNLLWIANYARKKSFTHLSVYISKEQDEVLSWLKKNTDNNSLIITSDNPVAIMATVLTRAYTWTSHNLATPFLSKKEKAYERFIRENKPDSAWADRNIIFIFNSNDANESERSLNLSFTADTVVQIHHYKIIAVNKFSYQ